jgi:hypothetical protein
MDITIFKNIIYLRFIFGLIVVILLVIFSTIGRRKVDKLSLKCPKCNYIFKPLAFRRSVNPFYPLNSFLWAFKIPTISTCPNCKRESWCKTIEDKDIEKEYLPIKELPPIKGYAPSLVFKIALVIIAILVAMLAVGTIIINHRYNTL